MDTHSISVTRLTKIFDTQQGPIRAVDGVSFEVAGGEFFTMLGPSGCGKTTTLRMIAGLESVTSGEIFFDGKDLRRISPLHRNIGMVFQSYALFPHLTVFENTAYGLRVRRLPEAVVRKKVSEILDLLGLQHLATRHPADLSGGQQQRVSIARALVYEPSILLLDEPLANLDAKLRVEMREEIRRIQKELGVMAIYVTHDQEEAMSISDRIAVFSQGKLMQLDTPQRIYTNPASTFVADFIGKANFFPAKLMARNGKGARIVLDCGIEIEVPSVQVTSRREGADAGVSTLMVRPDRLTLGPGTDDRLKCRVQRIQFLGSLIRYTVRREFAPVEVSVDSPRYLDGIEEGSESYLHMDASDSIFFHEGDGE